MTDTSASYRLTCKCGWQSSSAEREGGEEEAALIKEYEKHLYDYMMPPSIMPPNKKWTQP